MKIRNYRKGFTLIEVTIALALASFLMAYTYTQISEGILLKKQSDNLRRALYLTKLKMTQIESGNKISPDQSSGDIPGFKGYKYNLLIKEEEINLLELSGLDKEVPEEKSDDPGDRIHEYMKGRGKTQETSTGGIIKAFKIKIDITFPGIKGPETFTTETFKSNEF